MPGPLYWTRSGRGSKGGSSYSSPFADGSESGLYWTLGGGDVSRSLAGQKGEAADEEQKGAGKSSGANFWE